MSNTNAGPINYKLVVVDLETSGLNVDKEDCILEIAMAICDPITLHILDVERWLVLPPDVDGPRSFERWLKELEKTNKYVFDMHSAKYPSIDREGRVITSLEPVSLVDELRELSKCDGRSLNYVESVEQQALRLLWKNSSNYESEKTEVFRGLPQPNKSEFLLTGNSISNLDIPALRRYMPQLHAAFHYRILDVSVIKTWLVDIMRAPLPDHIVQAISKGRRVEATGEQVETHRAYDDVLACISQLTAVTAWQASR